MGLYVVAMDFEDSLESGDREIKLGLKEFKVTELHREILLVRMVLLFSKKERSITLIVM